MNNTTYVGRTNAGNPGTSGPSYYLFKLRLKEANESLQILVDKKPLGGKLLEKRMEEDDPGGGGREDRRESTAGTCTDTTRSETSEDRTAGRRRLEQMLKISKAWKQKRKRRASERKKPHD